MDVVKDRTVYGVPVYYTECPNSQIQRLHIFYFLIQLYYLVKKLFFHF